MPAVGDVLGDRYRIDGVLGAGGMASVYLATDLRLERQVAVKVLLPNLARDPSLAERFDREARILASVSHPNVAEVFDVERGDPGAGREPFYVMELCEGGSLASRIEAGGALEPGALVPIIVSIAAALGELHRRGLIHRDVKPANILFTGGRPKLADFGLTKSGGDLGLDTITVPGTAIGTPAYMAPELVAGGAATVASDVYALAATTFHGLTGRAPRQAESLTTLATVGGEPLAPISEASPRLGSAFDEVVARALADDPASRPPLNTFSSGLVAALDRSGQPLAAPVVAVPAAAAPLPVDPLEDTNPTVVATPTIVATRRAAEPPASPVDRRPARNGPVTLATAVLAVAFVVIALIALSGLASFFGSLGQGATASPPVAATEGTPSPSPSLAPPSPSPTPIVTLDPAAPALEALRTVQTAISSARGGKGGLNGGEANDLSARALQIERELHDGDYAAARETATDLQKQVEKLKLEKKRAEALKAAVEDLIANIPS